MAQDFESAKAFLKRANGDGKTLYDHLTNVLLEVVQQRPENALKVIEAISARTKAASLAQKPAREVPVLPQDGPAAERLAASLKATKKLIQPVDPEDEDAEVKEPMPIPDIVEQANVLEWAGVNLGREEAYKIALSIQALATEEELSSVRFWGKVFGTGGDYLIVEAKLPDWPDEDLDEDNRQEPIGTPGANEYVYFAASSTEGPWRQLPVVTPQQIITARSVRRFFTGNLDAPVLGFPRFPWGEASYLRAQIARITAATTVSPKGYFMTDGDDEDAIIIEDEEYEAGHVSELASLEGWVHHRPHLLRQGRTQPWQEPEPEDEDEELPEQDDEEPAPPLSSLDGDEPDTWAVRVAPNEDNPGAVASVHSLTWSGAVTACKKNVFATVYVGFGLKTLAGPYTPPPPPAIQQEYVAPVPEDDEDEVANLVEQEDPLPPEDDVEEDDEEKFEGDEDEGDWLEDEYD